MATGDLHNKCCEDQSSSSRNMLADRHTDRQTDHNTPLPYRGGVINSAIKFKATGALWLSPGFGAQFWFCVLGVKSFPGS